MSWDIFGIASAALTALMIVAFIVCVFARHMMLKQERERNLLARQYGYVNQYREWFPSLGTSVEAWRVACDSSLRASRERRGLSSDRRNMK